MRTASKNRAFTLIEMLLALAIGGMLMTAISIFVVSLAEIWLHRGEGDFLKQHAGGVGYFLNNSLAHAEKLDGGDDDPVHWDRPPGYSEFAPPLLTFSLKEAPALLDDGDQLLPGLTCYLHFIENEGLSLLWHSRLRKTESMDEVRRTPVSAYVTKMLFCYYDGESNTWEETERPEEDLDGAYMVPDFLKLQFEYLGDTRLVKLYLPKRGQNVPIF